MSKKRSASPRSSAIGMTILEIGRECDQCAQRTAETDARPEAGSSTSLVSQGPGIDAASHRCNLQYSPSTHSRIVYWYGRLRIARRGGSLDGTRCRGGRLFPGPAGPANPIEKAR